MKRVILVALALILLVSTVGMAAAQPPHPVRSVLGDVNRDGKVNSTDALIVLSCEAGVDCARDCPMNCGDVNGDRAVNSADAKIILAYDAGMAVSYPVGKIGCQRWVRPCAGCELWLN